MEKRKKMEAAFPEVIIQHIQYFLSAKEAAQSTLLSKSWYAAWLTRPNLDFNQRDFVGKSGHDTQASGSGLWKFVKKTVGRYDKLNLKMDNLKLWIYDSYDERHYITKLIKQALKIGATGLDFKNLCQDTTFTLPHEVFGSENLARLSASGCKIVLGADGKVNCSRLKSLTLEWVCVEDYIIQDIISSCPLIENFSLSTSNDFRKQTVGLVVGTSFNKLKSLLLSRIDVDTLFFDDFSSKFPCLKDLSIHHCGGFEGIQVSSPSLERISFIHDVILMVKFDVPSIRKFTFSGPVPLLSFKTTTSNWESDISISCFRTPSADWILMLNKLLIKLSRLSKVSLSLEMYSWKRFDCTKNIKGLTKPIVENLTFNSFCSGLFNVVFRCCRPIYVTQYWSPAIRNNNYIEFVYKRLVLEASLVRSSASQSMFGDLEEVDVEFFDEAVAAWRPQLLDYSTRPEDDEQRIRLHLTWGR